MDHPVCFSCFEECKSMANQKYSMNIKTIKKRKLKKVKEKKEKFLKERKEHLKHAHQPCELGDKMRKLPLKI